MSDVTPYWAPVGRSSTVDWSANAGALKTLMAARPELTQDPEALLRVSSALGSGDPALPPPPHAPEAPLSGSSALGSGDPALLRSVTAAVGPQIDQRLQFITQMNDETERAYWAKLSSGSRQALVKAGYHPLGGDGGGSFLGLDLSSSAAAARPLARAALR